MKTRQTGKFVCCIIPVVLLLITGLIFFGCDATPGPCGEEPDIPTDTIVPEPVTDGGSRTAVVADWLNKSLSIISLDALQSGATYNDVLIDRIDLSRYSPGPIDVAVTKDGKMALVSISAGWFATPGANAIIGETVPAGQSRLLFVDLEQKTVVDELNTGSEPMSIVFNGDGSKAFVAHFGSNYVAVVDVQNRSISQRINVGIYSEEIAHDDTNSVGIVSYSATGNVRTYGVSNPSASLSRAVNLSGDAAGVAFFPKTKVAFAVQSPTPLNGMRGGYTLLNVNSASSPAVLADERYSDMPACYPAVAASNRGTVLVPTTQDGRAALREYRLYNQNQSVYIYADISVCSAQTFGAMGLVYDAFTGRAIMAMPRAKVLAITDLETHESFTIAWPGSKAGPAEIALIP